MFVVFTRLRELATDRCFISFIFSGGDTFGFCFAELCVRASRIRLTASELVCTIWPCFWLPLWSGCDLRLVGLDRAVPVRILVKTLRTVRTTFKA